MKRLKWMRRAAVFLLALLMILAVTPFTAAADDPADPGEGSGYVDLLNITYTNNTGADITVEPVIESGWFDWYDFREDDLTPEELTSFGWNQIIYMEGLYNYENLEIRITERTVTDEEKEGIEEASRDYDGSWTVFDYCGAYEIELYVDGQKAEGLNGNVRCTLKNAVLPEGADTLRVFGSGSEWEPVSRKENLEYDSDEEILTWTYWDPDNLDSIIVAEKEAELCTIPIDTVKITGATLSFQAGQDVVFTGRVDDSDEDLYETGLNMPRGYAETWEGDDGSYTMNSSVLGDPPEYWAEGFFKTFSADRTYTYSVGAVVSEDAWFEGYYFDDDVKLVLNGEEMSCTGTVSDGSAGYLTAGRWVSFGNVTSFSTAQSTGPVSLSEAEVTIPDCDYTGKNITPKATVKIGNKTLVKGTDYDVYYLDSQFNRITAMKNPGLYLAVFTGKGDYTDGTSAEFLIRFADVKNPKDFWYGPVYWAVEKGITTGWLQDGTFRPWNTCNRAAVVTFLWRLAGRPEPSGIAGFKDMPADTEGNQDFRKAISWAAEQNITSGWSDNTFRPWNTCNRAAIITFIWRFADKPASKALAGFKDMPANNAGNQDFRKAISWGSENGIVSGWSDNTFRPWNDCNRASTVTFLYRYAHL